MKVPRHNVVRIINVGSLGTMKAIQTSRIQTIGTLVVEDLVKESHYSIQLRM